MHDFKVPKADYMCPSLYLYIQIIGGYLKARYIKRHEPTSNTREYQIHFLHYHP